ncbi:unnamed protein product [Mucor hiemalis]
MRAVGSGGRLRPRVRDITYVWNNNVPRVNWTLESMSLLLVKDDLVPFCAEVMGNPPNLRQPGPSASSATTIPPSSAESSTGTAATTVATIAMPPPSVPANSNNRNNNNRRGGVSTANNNMDTT